MSIQEYQVLLVTDNDQDARSLEESMEQEQRATRVGTRAQDMEEAL